MIASRLSKPSFAAGLIAGLGVCLAALWYVERRVGLSHLWADLSPFETASLDVPPRGLHAELIALGAVPDNLPNFTGTPEHGSFLVRPDSDLEYVLRPGVRADAFILRSRRDFNIDPPVLYLPAGAALSPALRAYLDAETRVRYQFSIDAAGHRTTTPEVAASRRVLVVGDSVAFGLGVGDGQTMASRLQQRAGGAYAVVNAGVAGYDASQIVKVAGRLSATSPFDALVYVANMNDFAEEDDSEQRALDRANEVLQSVAALQPRMGGRLLVYFHGDIEFALRHLMNADRHGWTGPWVRHAGAVRARLRQLCAERGVGFVDGVELVDNGTPAMGTIFSPFAFYVDHAHLSPLGNEAAAAAIARALAGLGLPAP